MTVGSGTGLEVAGEGRVGVLVDDETEEVSAVDEQLASIRAVPKTLAVRTAGFMAPPLELRRATYPAACMRPQVMEKPTPLCAPTSRLGFVADSISVNPVFSGVSYDVLSHEGRLVVTVVTDPGIPTDESGGRGDRALSQNSARAV